MKSRARSCGRGVRAMHLDFGIPDMLLIIIIDKGANEFSRTTNDTTASRDPGAVAPDLRGSV